MLAALYHEFGGPITVAEAPDPRVPDDGVIVRVRSTGLCRSDWHGWQGHDPDIRTFPHVPGHEVSGTIVATGSRVLDWSDGDHVIVPFVCACGSCTECARGNQHICDRQYQPGFSGWGSFAEFTAVPRADINLVRLPETSTFDAGALLGCRFATAFRAVMTQGRLQPDDTVLVIGCGGVGLSAVMIAAAHGATVIAVDTVTAALELAEQAGATWTFSSSSVPSIGEAVKALSPGGFDLSVDAVGSAATAVACITSLRKRGRHVQVGLMVDGPVPIPMSLLHSREIEIFGSHGMPATDYPPMIEEIRRGRLDPDVLITNRVDLRSGVDLLMSGATPPGVTVITDPGGHDPTGFDRNGP